MRQFSIDFNTTTSDGPERGGLFRYSDEPAAIFHPCPFVVQVQTVVDGRYKSNKEIWRNLGQSFRDACVRVSPPGDTMAEGTKATASAGLGVWWSLGVV